MMQGSRATGHLTFPIRTAAAVLALLALAACEDGAGGTLFRSATPSQGESPADGRSTRLIERDIEAPEVFQVTEAGLWDGRPSLGGVWVAHPDVSEPERVLIRNTANDSFVIGALFRRETMGPGPRLQVSSDAAAALDMLAGAPQQLNVTALRRETVDPEPVAAEPLPATAAAVPASSMPAAARVEDAPLDDPIAADTTATLATTAAAAGTTASATTEAAQPRRQGGLFGWLRGNNRSAEAAETAPASTAGTLAPAEVTATPLDAPAAAPTPAQAPAPAPVSTLEKPYIQLGIFSIRKNADDTATAMRQRALEVSVLTQESSGKTFYRVIAGPARSTEERSTMLGVVRDAGFTDAYPVTN